jgi:tRNA(fMet)-specific endonuclease VapC
VKTRYMVDTDWAIHWLSGQIQIRDRLEQIGPDSLALSAVSLAELWEGVHYSTDTRRSEQMLNNFLTGVLLIEIDEETCKIFGRERGRLRRLKRSIADFDLLIAATAIRYNLVLLSNNRKHFEQVHGLQMESLPL